MIYLYTYIYGWLVLGECRNLKKPPNPNTNIQLLQGSPRVKRPPACFSIPRQQGISSNTSAVPARKVVPRSHWEKMGTSGIMVKQTCGKTLCFTSCKQAIQINQQKPKDVCWVSPTRPRTQVHWQSDGPVQNGESRTKTSDFHNFGWRNGTFNFESFCSCWYKMDPLPVISPCITGTGPPCSSLCFNDTYMNQKTIRLDVQDRKLPLSLQCPSWWPVFSPCQ